MSATMKPDLEDLIHRGVVVFYGYQGALPDILSSKEAGRVKMLPGDISGVQMSDADVCFLDREALWALAVKFTMRMGERSQYWLVIQKTAEHQSGPAFLSEKVGVQGLLDHLRREKVNYVVLKFYEKLPA